MSFTMEDTLESGWVAVRPNVFDEKEKHKFVFIVAWNDVEGKFAITCHNRTVQRRSVARESVAEGTAALKPTELESKPKTSESPIKGKVESDSPTKKIGSPVKTEPCTQISVRRKDSVHSSPGKGVTREVGSQSRGPSRAMDIEVLDPTVIKGESRSPEVESADSEDLESNIREHCSWAGLFSFQDMRAVHLQLSSINSDLEPCLPPFPEEPSGMWTVLFGPQEVTEKETEVLCYQLQVYLGHALDTCGWKILSQVLFTESDDPEEYYESLSELRQKGYEEVLQRAKKRLHELLEKHKAMESMVELLEIYQEEDEAYGDLAEATTQLYQYLLQPFRDMRELAMLRRQQIKISMENDFLGPRRIEALQKEDADWHRKAQAAVLSIQDLTVKYFETTARAQKVVYERMRTDQKKFGKAAWAVAVDRMEKLQYSVSKETLQLMRAKEICLDQRKHSLREEMQGLQGGEDAMSRLDQLEALYYELQLQLYEIQFEILKYEEHLLTAQLESTRRQVTERQDEVVYYDTYESMDAMQDCDSVPGSVLPRQEELAKLQLRVRQLEARRGRITAKKAYLRNKKEICVFNHNEKMKQRQGSEEDHKSHHAQQQSEQEEEAKRSSLVSQERQKTLDRLRSFKQRYPGQVVLKSTRLRLAHSRRTDGGVTAPSVILAQRSPEAGALAEEGGAAPAAGKLESLSLPPGVLPLLPSPYLQRALSQCSALLSPPLPHHLLLLLPPPPPPSAPEDGPAEGPGAPGSPVRQLKVEGSEVHGVPLGPIVGRFFDSSQLVNARKKLKKTAALEASQSRRASSPMDEVLASLKRGSFHLRKAELRVLRPDPDQDDSNNILAQIRKGVKLKRVQQQELRSSLADLRQSADPLTRSIHEALRRIKEASPESEDEDDSPPCGDWES